MGKQYTKYGHRILLVSFMISYVATQQCSQVIKEHWVDLNDYSTENITLTCPSGFTVNMQYVKLVQAYQAQTGIMVECVIEPIYQYHSLCLGKQECVLTNPDYYKDIRGCNDNGNGTNHFIMEYFCDANPEASEQMSLCEKKVWTGSQLYLYSSPPGSEAISQTHCKCIITLPEQSEMAAYVGTFTKKSSIDGFDLNYNPCQQKVQMTTFTVYETSTYHQRSFCSRFAGLARETCSDRLKIIYLEYNSVTPWVSVNFSFSFTSPVDKPMKVECGITDILGRPTNPPPSTTTKSTTTALPTTTTTTPTTTITTTPTTITSPTTTTKTTTTTTPTTTTTTTTTASTTKSTTTTTGTTTVKAAIVTDTDPRSIDWSTRTPGDKKTKAGVDESVQANKTGDLPLELIVGVTGGVMGVFILVGMIAAAVCAKKRKTDDKASGSGTAGAQLSGDGSVYHVYEYVEPGARYSGVYAQPDDGSIPPVYPTYPRPMPDTLSSTPGYLDPPPDYPMDSLQNQRNERIQQDVQSNRWMSHVNNHDTTATRTTTSTKKHARFERDVEYIDQEEDVAHNPLYGKAHDLFFAY